MQRKHEKELKDLKQKCAQWHAHSLKKEQELVVVKASLQGRISEEEKQAQRDRTMFEKLTGKGARNADDKV